MKLWPYTCTMYISVMFILQSLCMYVTMRITKSEFCIIYDCEMMVVYDCIDYGSFSALVLIGKG